MPATNPRWLGAAVAGAMACLGPPARAEVAAALAADSDYRLRGLSLSDGRPSLSASLSYDHPSGLYAGLTGIAVDTRRSGVRPLGYAAYLGYARRLDSGLSWEVGVANRRVSVYRDHHRAADYTEIYGGLTRGDVSARLYFSPEYLGEGGRTLYAELDGAYHPAPRWRLFGHAGVLTVLRSPHDYAGRARYDLRLGAAREFGHGEVRAAWTTTSPASAYPTGYGRGRDAIVVGAALFF